MWDKSSQKLKYIYWNDSIYMRLNTNKSKTNLQVLDNTYTEVIIR